MTQKLDFTIFLKLKENFVNFLKQHVHLISGTEILY